MNKLRLDPEKDGLMLPRLWSDLDGTILKDPKTHGLLGVLKFHPQVMPGYEAFMNGLRGKVERAGIVSERPCTTVTRPATLRTIAQLKIAHLFDQNLSPYTDGKNTHHGHVFLTGSDRGKADFLVAESAERSVGFIDDKPLNVGREVIKVIQETEERRDKRSLVVPKPIVLGVVKNTPSVGQTTDLLLELEEIDNNMHVKVHQNGYDARANIGRAVLEVRDLPPFSYETGQIFGFQLRNSK